jgi:hypothetical protein
VSIIAIPPRLYFSLYAHHFSPLGVEQAGGQAQQGVDVALVQELAADGFAGEKTGSENNIF